MNVVVCVTITRSSMHSPLSKIRDKREPVRKRTSFSDAAVKSYRYSTIDLDIS